MSNNGTGGIRRGKVVIPFSNDDGHRHNGERGRKMGQGRMQSLERGVRIFREMKCFAVIQIEYIKNSQQSKSHSWRGKMWYWWESIFFPQNCWVDLMPNAKTVMWIADTCRPNETKTFMLPPLKFQHLQCLSLVSMHLLITTTTFTNMVVGHPLHQYWPSVTYEIIFPLGIHWGCLFGRKRP